MYHHYVSNKLDDIAIYSVLSILFMQEYLHYRYRLRSIDIDNYRQYAYGVPVLAIDSRDERDGEKTIDTSILCMYSSSR